MSAKQNECNSKPIIRLVMLPWLAYGHITPYLELAKKLTKTGLFIIHICSTPANLTCIQNKISHNNLSKSIKLIPLLLPINSPHLPSNLHTTNHLPHHLMPNLKDAFDSSANDFSTILADLKPDLLIYDFQPWPYLVAKEQNIPAVQFIISSCTSMCFMFHYFKNPTAEFPFPKIHFRDYEEKEMESLLETASNKEEMDKVFEEIETSSSKIVLIKGFRDMEGKYIDYLSRLVGRTYLPVGPLVQEPSPDDEKDDDHEILSWLDKKERRSTVLVSFGSEYFLNKEERDEIAHGLELVSKTINFIWVVRFPNCDNGLLEKTLPEGFLERVGSRGRILEWAPQTKILGHTSIGGFVSHCGWSSVMECMSLGVPIVGVPMQLDQPINARLVEEVGVGVEVLRDENKKLRGETLAAVIEHVVMEDSGEFVRQRAAEIGEKLRCRGDEEIDKVVKELVELCNKSCGQI